MTDIAHIPDDPDEKDEMIATLLDELQELREIVNDLHGWKKAASRKMDNMKEQIESGLSSSDDETPTPEGGETGEQTSQEGGRDRVAPLAAADDDELKDDCASLTLRIAAEVHRNAHRYAEAGNGGKKTFNRKKDLRALLKSALDMDRIYWKQIHRAMEYLDNYSPEFEHRKTERHGHILVTPSSVVKRRRR